ncbi:MAG TPA: TraB/GumN family protein, partial [Gammaproteobacteria bacterium]
MSSVLARASVVSLWSALLLTTGEPVTAQDSGDAPTIEEITVIGRYPGPPLWKVTRDEHTLWIFGDLSPVPKGLDWDPRNAERVLDRAGGVIGGPRVSAMTLNPIRLFRLFRAARRLVRLPEGTTLADQMPPELYARYTALRARHLPKVEDDDEDLRPALAALRVYGAAL